MTVGTVGLHYLPATGDAVGNGPQLHCTAWAYDVFECRQAYCGDAVAVLAAWFVHGECGRDGRSPGLGSEGCCTGVRCVPVSCCV